MKLKLSEIKLNPNNPRIIKDDKFKKLKKSIQEFPEMLDKRPIVIDENNIILGWNMRYKALQDLWIKEVEVIKAEWWTEEQKKEFLIKDNVWFWEWDMDMLANEWDEKDLKDWWVELKLDDINFDDIEWNEDRKNSNKTKEVECPSCWEKFSI